jgi:hypothetical protein
MLPAVLLAILVSAPPPAVAAETDLDAQITRLSSASAVERSAAQRYLAAHLDDGNRELIRSRLSVADAETRARWIEILSAEDRLSFVAAQLAASDDRGIASAGRAALEGAILRWNPEARAKARIGSELIDAMGAWIQPRVAIDVPLVTGSIEPVIDLLARIAPAGIGIALDPNFDAAAPPLVRTNIEASFTGAVRELAARHGLQLVGFACGEEKTDPARWLALVAKPRPEAAETSALGLLRDWSVAFARGGPESSRAAAALASSGWPAGVVMLGRSWRANGDPAAAAGLALAARRERIAPELFDPSLQAGLRAALADPSGDCQPAVAAALALGATGMRAPDGSDLCATALAGLDRLGGRVLFLSLVEIDARRPNDVAARSALDRVLAREDVPPGARFLALQSRARFAAPLEAPARAVELVEFAAARGRLADLLRWMRDARAFPPEAWRDPARLPASWGPVLVAHVAGAWLARGEAEAAGDLLSHALGSADASGREAMARALRDGMREASPGTRDALLARLRAKSGDGGVAALRLMVLAGAGVSESHADEVLRAIAEPAVSRDDLLLLGALSASPRGARARELLAAALSGNAPLDDLVAALDLAVQAIRATRDHELEREFTSSVRASDANVSAHLRVRLRVGRWPAPPEGEPVRLGDMDRSCARFGL